MSPVKDLVGAVDAALHATRTASRPADLARALEALTQARTALRTAAPSHPYIRDLDRRLARARARRAPTP